MQEDITSNKRIIKELCGWTWIAILLPGLSIFGVIILWTLGLTTEAQMFMTMSGIMIIVFTVIWWWWAINIVSNLIKSWNATKIDIQELIDDVKELKELMEQVQIRSVLVHVEHNKKHSTGGEDE